MYPFITISWIHLEVTGIGIILCFLVFMIVCRLRCKIMELPFKDLFYSLPGMIALIYLWWSYMRYILDTGNLLPHSIIDMYTILLPDDYKFHISGMIIWLIIFLIIFINQQSGRFIRHKRIDCIYIWLMQSIIVLGIFLVLWDDMIGVSTESRIGIYALTPLSEVAKFNKVYPVWLFLSIAALLSFIISFFFKKRSNWPGWWYAGFWTFLLWLWVVLLFQHYPRHGVILLYDIRYDINQYICRLLWVYCIIRYLYISHIIKRKMIKRVISNLS